GQAGPRHVRSARLGGRAGPAARARPPAPPSPTPKHRPPPPPPPHLPRGGRGDAAARPQNARGGGRGGPPRPTCRRARPPRGDGGRELGASLKRILCISAHPDDNEFSIGGTVARWSREGRELVFCLVTTGGAGVNEHTPSSDGLIPVREKESRAAARILGVSE